MQKTIDGCLPDTNGVPPAATGVSAAMTQHPMDAPLSPILDRTPAEKLPPYFTKTQLNRNRRWTFAEIDAFLGEPDVEKRMGDTTAKLYDKMRVLEVESRREWRDVATRLPQVPLPSWARECPHGYYRVRDLMDRGWYRADIDMFLGNHPHRSGKSARGYTVKLYKVESVHEIENTEGFVYRPAAVAPLLFLQGLTLSKIREMLSLTHSEVLNYTNDVREAVRHGKLKRNLTERKHKKQRNDKTLTPLQKKGVVYFRMAGHSWSEVAHLLNLPLNKVQNFGRTHAFCKLRQDAMLCLEYWIGTEATNT